VKQLIGGIAVILLSMLVWFQSRTFPQLPDGHPGPGLFPGVVAVALFLCGAVLSASALWSPRPDRAETEGTPAPAAGGARIAAVLLALVLYPFASVAIGFVPTISITCFLVALLLKARPVPGAVTALGGTLVIYLLFTRVLGVPL
jgi:putative tricarboxylic transport membrane protein